MKLMAWNCWGLGNAPTVRGLLRCHKAKRADILFLFETKLDEKRMQVFKKKLGLANMEVVDCVGKGEGLVVLWGVGLM
jgi:exonuclease III